MSSQFYQGLNSLTLKSTTPLTGVGPGDMAVSPNGQTVVIGSNVAAAQMSAYASSPWSSWNNMTTPLSTGSAVSSIKYV